MDAISQAQFPPGYLEENNGGRVIAATTVILVLTTILFALRLIARSLTEVKRGWDDHVLIPSYILLIGVLAIIYVDVTQAGLGRHAAAVMREDPTKLTTFAFLLYLLFWFYIPSNVLPRVSIVILYLRIFTNKWARAACWAVLAFLITNGIATIIAAQLQCTPIGYTWDKGISNGKCFNLLLWYKITNFLNILGDVLVFILPIKTVWTIQTSIARRAGIAAVFLTGSIGIIASSVRTGVFFVNADLIQSDPTFADAAFIWTAIETGLYFAAACLIGLRPLTRLPHFIRARVLHLADSGRRPAQDTDELRLNEYYKAPYAAIEGNEEAPQILFGATVSTDTHRNPEHYGTVGDRNEIHVETQVHVTRT